MAKFQSNKGEVLIGEPAHVNAAPTNLTLSRAQEWASRTALLSIHPQQIKGFEQTIADLCTTMMYTKAAHDNDGLPESDYAHNSHGTRKENQQYHVFITQPDSAWKTRHLNDLKALKQQYPWNESFFKDTARASYDIGGAPIKPGTKTVYTRNEWYALLKQNFDNWDAQLGLQISCLNGLTTDTLPAFTPCVGMVEAAFGPLDHTLPSLASWEALGDLTWNAQQFGWTPWLYVKMNALHNSVEWREFRELSLASAFLWDKGSLLYNIGGKEGSPCAADTQEYLDPWYRPNIGMPAKSTHNVVDWKQFLRPEGVYIKPYTNGRVIVNPTTGHVPFTLKVDNSKWDIGPQTGMILRRTASGWQRV